MVWKKKSFEKGPKMNLPKGTTIFGAGTGNIRGDGKSDIITLDKFSRLSLLSEDGKTQWTSLDRFGETDNYYQTKEKKNDDYRDNSPWTVYIPGRVVIKDLEGEGIPQVIVSKNEPTTRLFGRARSYESGEIYCLAWDQSELVTSWKTKPFRGYISDFQVKDVDNDGNEELVLAVVNPDETKEGIAGVLSSKKVSNVYFFKLF
jgi:hypothetical protein